jgi:hypothetical protein
LALLGLGVYATTKDTSLSLPLSPILPFLSTLLPLLNLGAFAHVLALPSSTPSNTLVRRSTLPLLFLLIIDTVIITLSSTHLDSEANACALFKRWQTWFQHHDAEKIKHVQDLLQCCGFATTKHMPFPFPDGSNKHPVPATRCVELTGRTRSCEGPWAQAEKGVAGTVLAVGVVLAVGKVCPPYSQGDWY